MYHFVVFPVVKRCQGRERDMCSESLDPLSTFCCLTHGTGGVSWLVSLAPSLATQMLEQDFSDLYISFRNKGVPPSTFTLASQEKGG